jgi:hypothetical protein
MKTMTPKEIAVEFGTDARTLRKFLRSTLPDAAPGKGSRWSIEARQVRSLRTKFDKWDAARNATPDAADEPIADDHEVDEVESTD